MAHRNHRDLDISCPFDGQLAEIIIVRHGRAVLKRDRVPLEPVELGGPEDERTSARGNVTDSGYRDARLTHTVSSEQHDALVSSGTPAASNCSLK